MNKKPPIIKSGLFGIGLDTYWPQFDGLKERLEGYQSQISVKMEGYGAQVINLGLVDSPLMASEKAELLKKEDIDTEKVEKQEN